jgi:hypothetical protein
MCDTANSDHQSRSMKPTRTLRFLILTALAWCVCARVGQAQKIAGEYVSPSSGSGPRFQYFVLARDAGLCGIVGDTVYVNESEIVSIVPDPTLAGTSVVTMKEDCIFLCTRGSDGASNSFTAVGLPYVPKADRLTFVLADKLDDCTPAGKQISFDKHEVSSIIVDHPDTTRSVVRLKHLFSSECPKGQFYPHSNMFFVRGKPADIYRENSGK